MSVERYDVYLYSLPKLTEDGKPVLPGDTTHTQQFATLDEARSFSASNASKFDRVIVMRTTEGAQLLVERYIDGQHEQRPPS